MSLVHKPEVVGKTVESIDAYPHWYAYDRNSFTIKFTDKSSLHFMTNAIGQLLIDYFEDTNGKHHSVN